MVDETSLGLLVLLLRILRPLLCVCVCLSLSPKPNNNNYDVTINSQILLCKSNPVLDKRERLRERERERERDANGRRRKAQTGDRRRKALGLLASIKFGFDVEDVCR